MPRKTTTKTAAATTPPAPAPEIEAAAPPTPKLNKLERVEALIRRPGGASLAEMMAETGWQQHSVRGAMAGALKKRGVEITSEKVGGERRYSAGAA